MCGSSGRCSASWNGGLAGLESRQAHQASQFLARRVLANFASRHPAEGIGIKDPLAGFINTVPIAGRHHVARQLGAGFRCSNDLPQIVNRLARSDRCNKCLSRFRRQAHDGQNNGVLRLRKALFLDVVA